MANEKNDVFCNIKEGWNINKTVEQHTNDNDPLRFRHVGKYLGIIAGTVAGVIVGQEAGEFAKTMNNPDTIDYIVKTWPLATKIGTAALGMKVGKYAGWFAGSVVDVLYAYVRRREFEDI